MKLPPTKAAGKPCRCEGEQRPLALAQVPTRRSKARPRPPKGRLIMLELEVGLLLVVVAASLLGSKLDMHGG